MLMSRVGVAVGWGEILRRTGRAIYEDDCLGWAAELAYFWFLALFPALLFVVALASYIPVETVIDALIRSFGRLVPGDVIGIVREQLVQVQQGQRGSLLTLSLFGAVWSGSSGMTAVIGTLNLAYRVKERRPWWRVRMLAIALTLALGVFTLIPFALVMVGPMLAEYVAIRLHWGAVFTWAVTVARWFLVFGLVVTPLGWIYYFAPDVRRPWAWVTPGSILATTLWMGVSLGFKWYAGHFGDYQQMYGTIGGVIVTLLWFYLSGLAILIGAQLNATIESASSWKKAPDDDVERPAPKNPLPPMPAHMASSHPVHSC
jgi:membrane protein